ncbi:hypothetical protein PgNI_05268 [Pyricularia grisea]|uniref:Uncharacterized protein n=1 Tax=Pyricularia grisea TaxID=148305 RepID=A0A6P8B748_PYRGI|nr:hypothetical protein PgNI_05268 [Pyricularia grisea]TLD11151.1 hypothetical protein PgNI_05268 [Pyricularia grisea]
MTGNPALCHLCENMPQFAPDLAVERKCASPPRRTGAPGLAGCHRAPASVGLQWRLIHDLVRTNIAGRHALGPLLEKREQSSLSSYSFSRLRSVAISDQIQRVPQLIIDAAPSCPHGQ